MSSLNRLIGILDHVASGHGVLTAEELSERLGYTRSTTYRHLKVLTDSGLLAAWHGNGYTLGPRIIELSSHVLVRDPLLLASKDEMGQLRHRFDGVALLCRRFKDRLVCIHRDAGKNNYLPYYGVGNSYSMEGSAAAQVMLSCYPSQKLRKHYQANSQMYGQNGLGDTLQQVRARLKFIREIGYATRFVPGDLPTTLISAPILDKQQSPIASLTLAVGADAAEKAQFAGMAEQVVVAARNISQMISA